MQMYLFVLSNKIVRIVHVCAFILYPGWCTMPHIMRLTWNEPRHCINISDWIWLNNRRLTSGHQQDLKVRLKESWLSSSRNIWWTLLTWAADECEREPINTQWTGIMCKSQETGSCGISAVSDRNIPSPVTLTLAAVLMVPNGFLASQMYKPSSLSQTPIIKDKRETMNSLCVREKQHLFTYYK